MDSSQHILNLLYRYAECIDSGDFDGLGMLFQSASIEYPTAGKALRGGASVAEFHRQTIHIYPDSGTPGTTHTVSNSIIDIDESAATATVRSCFTVTQQLTDFPYQVIAAGRYFDHFKRSNEGWAFSTRKVTPEYYGDLSKHLKSFQDERDSLRLVSNGFPTDNTAIKRV